MAPAPLQITMSVPHHSVFAGWMPSCRPTNSFEALMATALKAGIYISQKITNCAICNKFYTHKSTATEFGSIQYLDTYNY